MGDGLGGAGGFGGFNPADGFGGPLMVGPGGEVRGAMNLTAGSILGRLGGGAMLQGGGGLALRAPGGGGGWYGATGAARGRAGAAAAAGVWDEPGALLDDDELDRAAAPGRLDLGWLTATATDGVGSFDIGSDVVSRGASARRMRMRLPETAGGAGTPGGAAAAAEASALAGTLHAIASRMLPQEHRLLAAAMPRVAAADARALLDAAAGHPVPGGDGAAAAAAAPAEGGSRAVAGVPEAAAAAGGAPGISAQLASTLRTLLSQPQAAGAAGGVSVALRGAGGAQRLCQPMLFTAGGGGGGTVTPAQLQAMLNDVLLPNGQLDWAGLRDVEAMINSMLASGPGAAAGAAAAGVDPRGGWLRGAAAAGPAGRGGAAPGGRAAADEGVSASEWLPPFGLHKALLGRCHMLDAESEALLVFISFLLTPQGPSSPKSWRSCAKMHRSLLLPRRPPQRRPPQRRPSPRPSRRSRSLRRPLPQAATSVWARRQQQHPQQQRQQQRHQQQQRQRQQQHSRRRPQTRRRCPRRARRAPRSPRPRPHSGPRGRGGAAELRRRKRGERRQREGASPAARALYPLKAWLPPSPLQWRPSTCPAAHQRRRRRPRRGKRAWQPPSRLR
jgi:hypothetical protein